MFRLLLNDRHLLAGVAIIVRWVYDVRMDNIAHDPDAVPGDVTQLIDKDNDRWYKLADGRWLCRYENAIADLDQLVRVYGPVKW